MIDKSISNTMINDNILLIITNKHDITTDMVVRRLRERQIPYFRFNTESFPCWAEGTISIDKNIAELNVLKKKTIIRHDQIKAVWYRRPAKPDIFSFDLNAEDYEFANRECSCFLNNFWTFLDSVFWVNDPFSLIRAEQKSYQLKIAASIGLNIPSTLFSNSYQNILSFVNAHNGCVVVKPISHGAVGKSDEKFIFTNYLENIITHIKPEEIKVAPLIIQEKVNKKADVRLTVFGRNIFAYEIIPLTTNNTTFLDWREYKYDELLFKRCEPPQKVVNCIYSFMDILGIKYGAFDFSISQNGEWYFLEVNPSGQFAWLEISTKDPLVDSLINLLCAENT